MLKLRLKKFGRKGLPSYRLVVMERSTKRDGKPIEELGFYDTLSKRSFSGIYSADLTSEL